MTIEVIETGELVEPMSVTEAERVTARIADKLDTIADNLEQVMPLIREALTREAWRALGYAGATAYVSDRFSKALGRLPRDVRQPVVVELSAAGMSTRAIAPIVGISPAQVKRDVAGGSFEPPEPNAPTGFYGPGERIESGTPMSTEDIPPVQGLDGKAYPRPITKPPTQPAEQNPSRELTIVNDIRLYVGKIGTAPEIRSLSPKAKQHIIDALTNAITELRK